MDEDLKKKKNFFNFPENWSGSGGWFGKEILSLQFIFTLVNP